jgi:hypothetical protein
MPACSGMSGRDGGEINGQEETKVGESRIEEVAAQGR